MRQKLANIPKKRTIIEIKQKSNKPQFLGLMNKIVNINILNSNHTKDDPQNS